LWTFAASGLRESASMTKCCPMGRRDKWRKFIDNPIVEWSILAAGILLIIGGLVIAPLPGPGGIFLIAPGVALVLKTSMWAKRRYVKFKRWQPKAGRWTDWALQRRSAKRREALRKAEQEQRGQVPESRSGN
jgi:hypothetical protein